MVFAPGGDVGQEPGSATDDPTVRSMQRPSGLGAEIEGKKDRMVQCLFGERFNQCGLAHHRAPWQSVLGMGREAATRPSVGGVCVPGNTPPPIGGGGNVEIVEIIMFFLGWERLGTRFSGS